METRLDSIDLNSIMKLTFEFQENYINIPKGLNCRRESFLNFVYLETLHFQDRCRVSVLYCLYCP